MGSSLAKRKARGDTSFKLRTEREEQAHQHEGGQGRGGQGRVDRIRWPCSQIPVCFAIPNSRGAKKKGGEEATYTSIAVQT